MNELLRNWRNVSPAESAHEGDDFLARWRDEARVAEASLKQEAKVLDSARKDVLAEASGFRSWRQMVVFLQHTIRVRGRFVQEPAFRELWRRLRLLDIELGEPLYFGAHHGGVPAALLQAVENWHQLPRFTAAERKKHAARIDALCDELAVELSKTVPSSEASRDFGGFWLAPEQVKALMVALRTRDETLNGIGERPDLVRAVGHYALQKAGITPMWAVGAIREGAAKWSRRHTGLPRKIRSAGAIKTYFIHVLESAVDVRPGECSPSASIGDQLRADIVGLLADVDCSADDVRKARLLRHGSQRAED